MAGEGDSFALGRQSARAEARGLLPLLLSGSTVKEIRELIAVPPRTERTLRAFARAHPEEAYFIERTLKFRQAVAREFERLVREGFPDPEILEADDGERDASEETFANAQP
jgi:hypothetical protein